MQKFYKQKIYKRYNDEIWGSLITSKKFSYNKKAILLNYKDMSVQGRFNLKTKFKYFRRGFLKHLNRSIYSFKATRRMLRLCNFLTKKTSLYNTSNFSRVLLKPNYRIRRRRRRHFRRFGARWFYFNRKKSVIKLKHLFTTLFAFRFKALKFELFRKTLYLGQGKFVLSKFPPLFASKSLTFWNFTRFVRINNLRYIIRKKLNLKKEKAFFYSVHVASPYKKRKKWSLFGLKGIYYRKISLFFGFKKVADFFKFYTSIKSIWGRNESALFLALECRLENFLYRLNYFPSFYFIKRFVLSGNVLVNNKVIHFPSYVLAPGDVVSINKSFFKFIYASMKSRLLSKKILLNVPSFIEVDYKLLVAVLLTSPNTKNLTLPVSFDLYTTELTFNK